MKLAKNLSNETTATSQEKLSPRITRSKCAEVQLSSNSQNSSSNNIQTETFSERVWNKFNELQKAKAKKGGNLTTVNKNNLTILQDEKDAEETE